MYLLDERIPINENKKGGIIFQVGCAERVHLSHAETLIACVFLTYVLEKCFSSDCRVSPHLTWRKRRSGGRFLQAHVLRPNSSPGRLLRQGWAAVCLAVPGACERRCFYYEPCAWKSAVRKRRGVAPGVGWQGHRPHLLLRPRGLYRYRLPAAADVHFRGERHVRDETGDRGLSAITRQKNGSR
jgi:hypothetical protein